MEILLFCTSQIISVFPAFSRFLPVCPTISSLTFLSLDLSGTYAVILLIHLSNLLALIYPAIFSLASFFYSLFNLISSDPVIIDSSIVRFIFYSSFFNFSSSVLFIIGISNTYMTISSSMVLRMLFFFIYFVPPYCTSVLYATLVSL